MNIEIANRFVQLRKENGLSQEQLAEKIGVSRQAVSKWERSEASPDTDNLILLARLYNISLDELLKTDDDIPKAEETEEREEEPAADGFDTEANESSKDKAHIGWDGIHVEDGEDSVHIDKTGIHVNERYGDSVHIDKTGIHVNERYGDNVSIDKNGVFVNGERYDSHIFEKSIFGDFPVAIIVIITYICLGLFSNLWHPGWLLFFIIPLYHGAVSAVRKRSVFKFPYPIFVTAIFLCYGILYGLWNPTWVIFLTIPIFYWIADIFKHRKKDSNNVTDNQASDEDNG